MSSRILVYVPDDVLAEEEPVKNKRGRRLGVIVIAIAVALVLLIATVIALYLNSLRGAYQDAVTVIPEEQTFPESPDRPEPPMREDEETGEQVEDEQVNILLIGSDSGGGSGETEDVPWLPNGARADTLMWMHIPHDRDSIQVMSMMRDTWVPVPGHGEMKINASLSFGDGSETTVATVENLIDVPLDHVASVDMAGFQSLVEAMDGVDVNSPAEFTSRDGYHFQAGPQHMRATEAMSFVRERRAFSGGDDQRTENQQALMRGVMNQVLTVSTLSNPVRVYDMVSSFASHMSVDSGLGDADYMADLAVSLREIGTDDIQMFTAHHGGMGTAGSESIVVADYDAFEEAGHAMREGSFDEYAAAH